MPNKLIGHKEGHDNLLKRSMNKLYREIRPYYHLVRLLFAPKQTGKRILGIWDYKALPWSVGDPLVFIEKLSIMKIENKAEKIDICIIYDCENPAGNRQESRINNDSIYTYLPIFSTCPYLGSIFQFNSRAEFQRFLSNNLERYCIYPPLMQHLSEKYNYLGGAFEIKDIQLFFRRNGYIPFLRVGKKQIEWAATFYKKTLPENSVPVTLSFRQPLSKNDKRNADPAVWLHFIDKCQQMFPEIRFIVVGTRDEIFPGLKERANVICAKEYGTSIIEDFALIRASCLYLGTSSGINTIANYSDLPYLIFQLTSETLRRYGLDIDNIFPFIDGKQKAFADAIKITPELLIAEFSQIYSKLDKTKWLVKGGAPNV